MPKTKTIEELRRELKAKESVVKKILVRRAKVQAKLDKIDRKIAALTGGEVKAARGRPAKADAPAGRRARRWHGGKPLVEYIQQVLAKAPEGMRVKEVVAAVAKAGYKSASKNFYGMVAVAINNPKLFKKLGRGVYKLA